MTDSATQARPASPGGNSRPKGRPGRKPKGSGPVVVVNTPDQPDPDHVLTWRQRKILQVIRDSVLERGFPPSMQEIAVAVGLTSTSSVLYQLSVLQRTGYLHRDAGRPRSMEVRLPGRPPVRPQGAVTGQGGEVTADQGAVTADQGAVSADQGAVSADQGAVTGEPGEAAASGGDLIALLASRRAELGLSRAEVARRMRTSQAAVARLEAQLAVLARYTQALGL